jgi:hypothetical protein
VTIVAALFVDPRGVYSGVAGVELWPADRDARTYPGPFPVVAHPPCSRWCQLAPVNAARYGHRIGDDGGCFSAALAHVRSFGGVLEHPAFSLAWPAYGLTAPALTGEWSSAGPCGGYVAHVEQGHFGHAARKATWLYARHVSLPTLPRGRSRATAWVSWMVNHGKGDGRRRISKQAASATPPAFAEMLLDMARDARP